MVKFNALPIVALITFGPALFASGLHETDTGVLA
jgi:hypothetical protein